MNPQNWEKIKSLMAARNLTTKTLSLLTDIRPDRIILVEGKRQQEITPEQVGHHWIQNLHTLLKNHAQNCLVEIDNELRDL